MRIPQNHFIGSIILGLAVANSFAYTTSCIPQSEILKEQFRTTATKAQWGIVLSTLGLGLGTILTGSNFIDSQLRAKYIIAWSSLLLSLCTWIPVLYPGFGVILLMRLIGGIWGAVPIYTSLVMFACTFNGLAGTNKGIMAFATIGGLGAGPIIGSVSLNFFGYSSTVVAILAMAIPNSYVPKSRHSLNPAPESPEADPNVPDEPTGLFLGWTILCIMFQYLRVPTSIFEYYGRRGSNYHLPQTNQDAVMPYYGIVLGAAVAAYTLRGDVYYKNGEKPDPKQPYFLEIARIVASFPGFIWLLSLQGFMWVIWDIHAGNLEHYYYYILAFLGCTFGAVTTSVAATLLAVQVDLFALQGVSVTVMSGREYIVSACLLFVLLGLIARANEAIRILLFALFDLFLLSSIGPTVTWVSEKDDQGSNGPRTDEEIEMEPSGAGLDPSGAEARITRLEEEIKALREELASAIATAQ